MTAPYKSAPRRSADGLREAGGTAMKWADAPSDPSLSDIVPIDLPEEAKCEILSNLSSVSSDAQSLYNRIAEYLSDIGPSFSKLFIETDIFSALVESCKAGPSVDILLLFHKILSKSPILSAEAIKRGLYSAVVESWMLQSPDLSHISFKIIRDFVNGGVAARTALFGLGLFSEIYERFQAGWAIGQCKHLAKTLFYFASYDPVFSPGGYSSAGASISKRSDVKAFCRELGVPSKRMFAVSEFLKTGNTFKTNKDLWRCADFLMKVDDPCLNYYGVAIVGVTVQYNPDNCRSLCQSTDFLTFSSTLIERSDPKVQSAVFTVFSDIVFTADGQDLTNAILSDALALAFINLSSLDKSTWISATRLISNAISVCYPLIERVDSALIDYICSKINEEEYSISEEFVWLLINILRTAKPEQQRSLMNQSIISILARFAASSDVELAEACLQVLLQLASDSFVGALPMISQEEIIDSIQAIANDGNSEVAEIADAITALIYGNFEEEEQL